MARERARLPATPGRHALLITPVPLLGHGIAAALGADRSYHAAATVTDLPSARILLDDDTYDLVFCDESAATTDASLVQLLKRLTNSESQTPLIVMVHGRLSTGVRQLAAQAARCRVGLGVVDVTAQVGDLRRAIGAIQSGRSFIDPSLAGELLQVPAHSLTPREQAVFEQMVTGATNKEIATVMHLSPETVKTHVRNILKKLDAPTRMAAVLQAQRTNAISYKLGQDTEIIHSAGVAVFSAGIDGTILSCNPAAVELYRCKCSDVLGKSLRFILSDCSDDDLDRLLHDLVSGAQPAVHVETRLKVSEDEEIELFVTISPIRDRRSDEVLGFSAISMECARSS